MLEAIYVFSLIHTHPKAFIKIYILLIKKLLTEGKLDTLSHSAHKVLGWDSNPGLRLQSQRFF